MALTPPNPCVIVTAGKVLAVPVPVPTPIDVNNVSRAAPVPARITVESLGGPIAVNLTPTVLDVAPINVKSDVPTDVMTYVFPTENVPVTDVAPMAFGG